MAHESLTFDSLTMNEKEALDYVSRHSLFISGWLKKNPEHIPKIFQLTRDDRNVDTILQDILIPNFYSLSEDELLKHLRTSKMIEYTAIAIKDLVLKDNIKNITAHISSFATASLEASYNYAYKTLTQEHGTPFSNDGIESSMVIIGLGKLGGWELNFSSDIDIMYVYDTEIGKTEGTSTKPPIENHIFFTKMSEKITYYVGARTEDGIVFRVDLRLRPDGDRGALALPVRSCEIYYESYGQDWERMMLLKARAVAGNKRTGADFLKAVRPFVFRRSLDHKLLNELQNVKKKIDRREEKRGNRNVKLGYGGIREIEFIVQAYQILQYPKRPEIYHPSTLDAIDRLIKLDLLDAETGNKLKE